MIVSHVITAAIIMTIDKETVSIAVIIVIPTLYTYSSTSEPPTHPSHHSLLAGEPWILLKLDINSSTMEKSSKIDPACLRNTSTITSHVSNDWSHGAPSFWSLAQGCSPAQKKTKNQEIKVAGRLSAEIPRNQKWPVIGEVPSYLVVYPTVVGVFRDSNACTSFLSAVVNMGMGQNLVPVNIKLVNGWCSSNKKLYWYWSIAIFILNYSYSSFAMVSLCQIHILRPMWSARPSSEKHAG